MSARAGLSVFLIAAALVAFMPLRAMGQDESGQPELKISVEMLMSGLTKLDASGHVKLTYYGQAAHALRVAINESFPGEPISTLVPLQIKEFMAAYSHSLVGRIWLGVTIRSATDFANASDKAVRESAVGLVSIPVNSSFPIYIDMDFSASGRMSTKLMQLSKGPLDTFAGAIAHVTGYSFFGALVVDARITTIGFASITNPDIGSGRISEIRTPIGNIAWYSFKGSVVPGELSADETLTLEPFSVFENSQVAFVVALVGAFIIARMPSRRLEKFRLLHPRKSRQSVKPLRPVAISAWVLIAAIAIIYALPFLTTRTFLLYSVYMFLIVPLAVLVEHFISRTMYDRAAREISEEPVIEVKQAMVEKRKLKEVLCQVCFKRIEEDQKMLRCPQCSLEMHDDCAERAQSCPVCESILFPERTRSIECRVCGETFLYSGMGDPYSIQCTKCGSFQEEIKPGKNYLVVEEEPRNSYMMARSMGLSGRPVMCLTAEFPGKVRGDYDLGENVAIKWLSDSTTDIDNVNPRDLEGDAMEIVSTFLMTTKSSGVLLDGLGALVQLDGFDATLAFIRRLNDLAMIHGGTIIVPMKKGALPEDQYQKISDEFDEIHDYT
jgi:hypothetical protein